MLVDGSPRVRAVCCGDALLAARRLIRVVALVALAGASLLVTGCGSSIGGTIGELRSTNEGLPEPWVIPGDAFPTQRLYRVHYAGPDGEVSFKLTLYLERSDRYRMDAADSLGRKAWSLALEPGGSALWVDHRGRATCRVASAAEQSFLPLAHLPIAALPRLVLGLIPAEPSDDLRRTADRVSFLDDRARLWSGQIEAGTLRRWTVTEAGEPVAWWSLEGDEGVFSDRRGRRQVRWSEQVREPLARPVQPLAAPDSYRWGDCSDPAALAPEASR
ncbi:MAG: hypothetical protein AAGN46_00410 [Acidobacteriota bacterium]